jgi:hypothetical protein
VVIDKKKFYEAIKESLFKGKLLPSQVKGMESIFASCDTYNVKEPTRIAYVMATAAWETARTMRPIKEFGLGKGRPYGKKIDVDGKPYDQPDHIFYGRGYVQLTWKSNYAKMGKLLGVDLVNNPDLALDETISAKILVMGMVLGLFTGRKLSDYITKEKTDFINSRRIINGTDRAELIAGYAEKFLAALTL